MTPRHRPPALLLAGLAAIALGGLACGDDRDPVVAEPIPGDLVVTLATPGGTEGAVMLTLTGPELPAADAVSAVDPDAVVLFVRAQGQSLRMALFGELSGGPLVVFAVPDTEARDRYTATLLEVAAPDHTLRASLSGYGLEVAIHD